MMNTWMIPPRDLILKDKCDLIFYPYLFLIIFEVRFIVRDHKKTASLNSIQLNPTGTYCISVQYHRNRLLSLQILLIKALDV